MLPLSVSVVSPTERRVKTCAVVSGFAQKVGTHVPREALEVDGLDARAQLSAGSWKVSLLQSARFSCATVKVPMPKRRAMYLNGRGRSMRTLIARQWRMNT
jgi:hypothetical protein